MMNTNEMFPTIQQLKEFLNQQIRTHVAAPIVKVEGTLSMEQAEAILASLKESPLPEVVVPRVTEEPKEPSTPVSVEEPDSIKKPIITPTPSQQAEVDKLLRWFKETLGYGLFQLAGFAGTGKTTIMMVILYLLGLKPHQVRMCAPTGTASLVLREKTPGYDACTLHRLFYEWEMDKHGKRIRNKTINNIKGAKLVICDESSMVSKEFGLEMIELCKKAKVKLLIIGDPGQLPPVDPQAEDRGERTDFFLVKPDAMLTEVMRQASGNPIVKLSMAMREASTNGVAYQFPAGKQNVEGKLFLRSYFDISVEQMGKAIQAGNAIIAGTNRVRKAYNTAIRRHLGFTEPDLMEGEKIVIKENCEGGEVTNGMRGTVSDINKKGHIYCFTFTPDQFEGSHYLEVHEDILFERKSMSTLKWENRYDKKVNLGIEAVFGYVITCHASQGGQWKTVYLLDESRVFNRTHNNKGTQIRTQAEANVIENRWKYTAVTRAAENLVVFTGSPFEMRSWWSQVDQLNKR